MSLGDSPALWIALIFFATAILSYSLNSITWLIIAWNKTTPLERVVRLDLQMFFAGRHRDERQLRWFRIRLITGNTCLLLAMVSFLLHYLIQETI